VTVTDPHRIVTIDESLVDERFVRAPGPGGQNVNKVATAVQLRYDVARAAMPADMRRRLTALAGSLMTQNGELLIQANRYRSQAQNRIDARNRLLELLRKASVRPRPRLATRPTAASRERRLDTKRHRSVLKRGRRDLDD
jgi:ribosome-associated protein